jgi:hypothetical protein
MRQVFKTRTTIIGIVHYKIKFPIIHKKNEDSPVYDVIFEAGLNLKYSG